MQAFKTLAAITFAATWAGCATAPQQAVQTGGLGMSSAGALVGQVPTMGNSALGAAAGQVPSLGAVAGMAPAAAQGTSLVDVLVGKLGVTPTQAAGGAGSIFSVAKQNMNPNEFSQLGSAVPGIGQYLAAAPTQAVAPAGGAGLMGLAESALGSSGGSLGTMATLVGSYQSLGLNSGMVSQFIPVILQYVQGQGGTSTMGLLQSALVH